MIEDDFADLEGVQDGDAAGDAGATGVALDPSTAEGRMALLASLAEAGGQLGELAAELVVSSKERAEKAVADAAQLAHAEEVMGSADPVALARAVDEAKAAGDQEAYGRATAELEAVKDVLRWQVLDGREAANDLFIAQMRQQMVEEGMEPGEVEAAVAVLKDQQSALSAAEAAGDPLDDSEAWAEVVQQKHWLDEEARIVQVLIDERPGQREVEVAEVQADLDSYVNALSGGRFDVE